MVLSLPPKGRAVATLGSPPMGWRVAFAGCRIPGSRGWKVATAFEALAISIIPPVLFWVSVLSWKSRFKSVPPPNHSPKIGWGLWSL